MWSLWTTIIWIVWSNQSIGPFCGLECRNTCSLSTVPLTAWNHRIDSNRSKFAKISTSWLVGRIWCHYHKEYTVSW